MTFEQFLDILFARYVCSVDKVEKRTEYCDSFHALWGKIDFQKLLVLISKYNDTDFVPPVAKALEWAKSCYTTEFKKSVGEWVHVKVRTSKGVTRSVDCFPPGTSLETIKSSYHNLFKTNDFEILEFY